MTFIHKKNQSLIKKHSFIKKHIFKEDASLAYLALFFLYLPHIVLLHRCYVYAQNLISLPVNQFLRTTANRFVTRVRMFMRFRVNATTTMLKVTSRHFPLSFALLDRTKQGKESKICHIDVYCCIPNAEFISKERHLL